MRLFQTCLIVVAFALAAIGAEGAGSPAPQFDGMASLDALDGRALGPSSDADTYVAAVPVGCDELGNADDAVSAQLRAIGARSGNGEILFCVRDVRPASELSERLFRPPIA